jgi:peptide/nickel transport system substrate-binding protein
MTTEAIGYNTDYDTNSPFPSPDIEKAKELMKEAGYEDGLTLRILAESTINFQLVTEQLAAMLSEIGITLDAELTDYATQNAKLYSGDVKGYDLYLSFSQACDESVATLDNAMLFGLTHPELSADGSYAGLQAIWDEIRITPDITKRTQLYKDAQAYFFENGLYWLPLNETQAYVGINKDLTGLRFNGSLVYFEDAYYR